MSSIKISGLSGLQKTLEGIPSKLAKNALRSGLRQGANVIKDAAKNNFTGGSLPKDVTGALKESIRVVSLKGSPTRIAFGVVAGALSNKQQSKFGKKAAFYAAMVEKGTVNMAARPFMKPALETQAQAAIDKVAAVVADKLGDSI